MCDAGVSVVFVGTESQLDLRDYNGDHNPLMMEITWIINVDMILMIEVFFGSESQFDGV